MGSIVPVHYNECMRQASVCYMIQASVCYIIQISTACRHWCTKSVRPAVQPLHQLMTQATVGQTMLPCQQLFAYVDAENDTSP